MVPGSDIVSELTRFVWDTVLGLGAEEAPPSTVEGDFVTSVDISGAWEGTVSISFPARLARRVAAAMLACNEDETTPSEIRDVVGELANMVGGNMKGVLPGPSKLSLPRVEHMPEGLPSSESTHCFECAGHRFSVTVSERARRATSSTPTQAS